MISLRESLNEITVPLSFWKKTFGGVYYHNTGVVGLQERLWERCGGYERRRPEQIRSRGYDLIPELWYRLDPWFGNIFMVELGLYQI